MSPAQQADLAELADSQRRLEERTNELLGKMNRMAEDRKTKDPEGAHDLKEAHDKAAEGNLDGHMKTAGRELDKNQLNEVQAEQKAAAGELQKMVKGFTERREDDLDRLAKKLAEKQKQLESLGNEQDELRKQIKNAAKAGDKDELARLGKKQKELAKKAKDLAEQLTRLGRRSGRGAAAQAGEAMDQDAARLEKGQKPEDEDARAGPARRRVRMKSIRPRKIRKIN